MLGVTAASNIIKDGDARLEILRTMARESKAETKVEVKTVTADVNSLLASVDTEPEPQAGPVAKARKVRKATTHKPRIGKMAVAAA